MSMLSDRAHDDDESMEDHAAAVTHLSKAVIYMLCIKNCGEYCMNIFLENPVII